MSTKNSENSEDHKPVFLCEICDYTCFKKQHLKQHFSTIKHKNKKNQPVENSVNRQHLSCKFMCLCGKNYTDKSGLWRHKKSCYKFKENKELEEKNITEIDPNIVFELLKQNQELQKTIIELSREKITINNNNCNNKTFNLNFFLNKQCKDALNITDFINSIKIQLSDLERVGQLGYVEGISKIFINNLKQLDTYKRPIHCSDVKREILYIKDEDKWEKDSEHKDKFKSAIKTVANENIKQIQTWTKKNPTYNDFESKKNDQYIKITMNSMSGGTIEEQEKNINQIIKNVVKEVIINK